MSHCMPGTLTNVPHASYSTSGCGTIILNGQLVPIGGSEGQVLGKLSDGAFDIAWVNAPSGPGSSDPALASRVTALEGQVQDLEVNPTLALNNGWVLTYDSTLGKWKSGPPAPPGNGNGDMLQSVYDTNNNGKVDDSEKLGGQLPSYYAVADQGVF